RRPVGRVRAAEEPLPDPVGDLLVSSLAFADLIRPPRLAVVLPWRMVAREPSEPIMGLVVAATVRPRDRSKRGQYMHSPAVEHHRKLLREDCARVDGKPFEYFLCPMLGVDEDVPLCMGHIVNDACPNSFTGRVVQREDVDNFYGSIVEADFTSLVQAWAMGPKNALLHPVLGKKMKPKFLVGGEECEHHHDLG